MGRRLVKRYGFIRALDNLDINVDYGIIYGLIGPNGAGKSTLIKSILGLVKLDGGELYVDGVRAPSKSILAKIGYMPQELSLYPDLTVEDNIIFYSRLYGLSGSMLRVRVDSILELLKLTKWRGTVIYKLSGGLQKRVSLAIALIHKPRILLLDEPTVGIDPLLRLEIWGYLRRLVREEDVTILLTTHYTDEARYCDKIGFIMNGRMIAEGRLEELMDKVKASSLEEAFVKYMEAILK